MRHPDLYRFLVRVHEPEFRGRHLRPLTRDEEILIFCCETLKAIFRKNPCNGEVCLLASVQEITDRITGIAAKMMSNSLNVVPKLRRDVRSLITLQNFRENVLACTV